MPPQVAPLALTTPRTPPPASVVVPRTHAVPRAITPGVQAQGGFNGRYNTRYYHYPRVVYHHPFYRPYYTFHPRFSMGYGLWAGYPVFYPYYYSSYAYSTPYPESYPVPYPAPSNAYPGPGSIAPTATGGLSFEITPSDATVYIDGQFVGAVEQFTPNDQPLPMAPGRHRVEVRAPGYQTIVFDVDIMAGQVIPYRGEMQRL